MSGTSGPLVIVSQRCTLDRRPLVLFCCSWWRRDYVVAAGESVALADPSPTRPGARVCSRIDMDVQFRAC